MICSWCGIVIGPGHEDVTPYAPPADYPGMIACGACYRLFARVGWRLPRHREDGRAEHGAPRECWEKRQREQRMVLARELVGQGRTRTEVALALGISPDTAREYIRAAKSPGEPTTGARA